MAIYRFSLEPRMTKNGTGGRDMVQYLVRDAQWSMTEVGYVLRKTPGTVERDDLRHVETQQLPSWASGDAALFFEQAARYERVGGRYAYAIQAALPRELSDDQQLALTRDFLEATMHDKALIWVKHQPLSAVDGLPQPHVHILMSARTIDEIDRPDAQHFARFCRDAPAEGGAEKDRFWNERGTLQHLRIAWADVCNYHLEWAQCQERIDPRRLRAQDIDRKPTGKSGKAEKVVRDVAAEQAHAAQSWEQRKAYKDLGNVQDISREEFVLLVRQWTREYTRGQEVERSRSEVVEAWLDRELARHEADLARLETARETLARARRREAVTQRDLLKALAAHDDVLAGGGLRMHLYEERSYGR